MGFLDYLVLLIILVLAILTLVFTKKKGHKCSGCCASCPYAGKCHTDEKNRACKSVNK